MMKIHKFKRDTLDYKGNKVYPLRSQNHSVPRIRKHVRFSDTSGYSKFEYWLTLIRTSFSRGMVQTRPSTTIPHASKKNWKGRQNDPKWIFKLHPQQRNRGRKRNWSSILPTTPFGTLNTSCWTKVCPRCLLLLVIIFALRLKCVRSFVP